MHMWAVARHRQLFTSSGSFFAWRFGRGCKACGPYVSCPCCGARLATLRCSCGVLFPQVLGSWLCKLEALLLWADARSSLVT